MVGSPEQWRWSSYHATGGQVQVPDWLATERLLSQFGQTRAQARARYALFVRDGYTQPRVWNGLRNQMYLGEARFVMQMQSRIKDEGTLDEIPRVPRRVCHTSLRDFARAHSDRRAAMAAAYESGAYTLKAITDYFGVHYSTVSRAVRDLERRRMGA